MTVSIKPGLFGLEHSNRDFTKADAWGKNQFNSAFPAALACWMGANQIDPVYLHLNSQGECVHGSISTSLLFGLPPMDEALYFDFESQFTPYADLTIGSTPRADVVTRNHLTNQKEALRSFEIKLTALPDSVTSSQNETLWGSEIVVRPDTIVYIALSIAQYYRKKRSQLLEFLQLQTVDGLFLTQTPIQDWADGQDVRPHINQMITSLEQLFNQSPLCQSPLLIQPIFKTLGKKSTLAEQCFDIFVWSNFALCKLFFGQSKNQRGKFTKHERSSVWLYKMLLDFATDGRINAANVIGSMKFGPQNDKAFACSGSITNPYMRGEVLQTPRVSKSAIKQIILGGGQYFLSPERRLDAIIVNSLGLFN
jgi:HindVP restriction endonuclease